jgi:ubiquinone/menaquinone biosynthesis C-methylase UbiE
MNINPIDYRVLWTQLVELGEQRRQFMKQKHFEDHWHGKAKEFDQRVSERWQQEDSSRSFLRKTLKKFPQASVLDIGAGSGAWVSLMAEQAAKVTALDPSASMLAQLRERVQREGLSNVEIVEGCWPDVEVAPHDIVFCSHAMYGAQDLPDFVNAMQRVATKSIILLIRAPNLDGLMSQAMQLVWGHPYDSPNYQIALPILWEMGIFPNVLMEEEHLWKPWTHPTLEDALVEMKTRLGLFNNDEWDTRLMALLKENLRYEKQEFVWPSGMRTALLFWDR